MKIKAKKHRNSNQTIKELDQWLNDPRNLNVEKIRSMSKRLNVPFGLFFLNEPPAQDDVIAEFLTTTIKNISDFSPELEENIFHMKEIQAWMSDYNQHQYGANFNYDLINRNMSPEQAAEEIRKFLDLTPS